MRYRQNAVLTSLTRTQQFLDAHRDALDAVNKSTRTQLDDVVTQLSALSIAQDSGTRGSRGESARQRALRIALRRSYMAPIADLAKFKLHDVPEFVALTLPDSNASTLRMISAAYAMADAATAHAQTLIDNGLPPTFADDLRKAAAAVSASLAERNSYQTRRTGATAGLGAEEKRGRTILRVLNALILVHIGSDAQLLAEWDSARNVRRKPGPAAGSHSAGTPTPMLVSDPIPTPVTPPVGVAA